MPDNTEKFTGRVDSYTRFRAPYPAADILVWLRQTCGLTPAWHLADLAAGTGMLTEVLLSNGNSVTAIEPNPEMRAACESLRPRFASTFALRDGTAEATGLPDRSVDLLTAARAFHWFDPPRALVEFRRVLRPGGWVVLLSSGTHADPSPQTAALEQLEITFGANPGYIQSRHDRQLRQTAFLQALARPVPAPAGLDQALAGPVQVLADPEEPLPTVTFRSNRHLDFEAFAGYLQSTSSAPLPSDPRYPAMQHALGAFFDQWSHNGLLTLPELCTLQAAQLPGATTAAQSF